MSDRSMLGAADLPDEVIHQYAAGQLGHPVGGTSLEAIWVEVVDYSLETVTTAGRWWVAVELTTQTGRQSVRFFVKAVQNFARSPMFAMVPEPVRAIAEATVPWETEPLVYASTLADHLPSGLTMPRAVDVRFLDEGSAAIWLPEVDVVASDWPVAQVADAARCLGRLTASEDVRPFASLGEKNGRRGARVYADGRLRFQLVPLLTDDEFWRKPALATTFGPQTRARLLDHLARVPDYVDWLESIPHGAAHGDACTNNILVQRDSTDLALIDFGFFSTQPVGFDLRQLILGDVQLGRRPLADAPELAAACLPAYVAGLADEGCLVSEEVVLRSHALHQLIFTGLSTFLFPELLGPDTPELHALAQLHADMARYALDVADATE